VASRSGGFQKGRETDAEILAVLEVVELGQLVEEDRAEGDALGADGATGRD